MNVLISKHSREKGFTLIELITVITIIGILATIAIPHYRGYLDKARMTTVHTTVYQFRLAQEAYWTDHKMYFSFAEPLTVNTSPEIDGIMIRIPPNQRYVISATNDDENEKYGYNILIETDFDRNMDGVNDLYQFTHDSDSGDTPLPLSPLVI